MVNSVRLKINGTSVDLSWSQFVANIESTKTSLDFFDQFDTAFILQCSTLLFLMQAGFILMETGSLSTKRRVNALILKNLGDTVLCAFFYLLIGYSLSHGEGGPFAGMTGFISGGVGNTQRSSKENSLMIFRFLKTATAVTILSGCVAERVNLWVYYLLVSVPSCFSIPLLARWTGHSQGWAHMVTSANSLFSTGVLDFAGAGEISVAGAMPALILLPIIGPRRNRFQGEWKDVRLPSQNNYFKTLGATIMWMGWYGLVLGEVSTLRGQGGSVVAKVTVNTTISAVAACITAIGAGLYYERKLCPTDASNGILSGLVGITGACATVDSGWALFIGIVSGLIYFSLTKVFFNLKLDDVVDGVQIHLCCGIWSLIAPALFSRRPLVQAAYPGFSDESLVPCGILYECNGLGTIQLGVNLVYCLLSLAWIGLTSAVIILPLWYFKLITYKSRSEGEDTTSYCTDDSELSDNGSSLGERLKLDAVQEDVQQDESAGLSDDDAFIPEDVALVREQQRVTLVREQQRVPLAGPSGSRIEEEDEDMPGSAVGDFEPGTRASVYSLPVIPDSDTTPDPLADLDHIQSVYPDIASDDFSKAAESESKL